MIQEIAKEKDISTILLGLENYKQKRMDSVWVIKYGDHIITTVSGKCCWKKENHAKAALSNHFKQVYYYNTANKLGFKNGTEIAQYLVGQGILKVEQL